MNVYMHTLRQTSSTPVFLFLYTHIDDTYIYILYTHIYMTHIYTNHMDMLHICTLIHA